VQSCLMVVGVNFRTAPLALRERYWMSAKRRADAACQLARMDGIAEAMALATCGRTEFILWTTDFSAAANSVLAFLNREYGLRLDEWKHFYRLLGHQALLQLFRVACGLDAITAGDAEIAAQLQSAWAQARESGAAGHFLGEIVEKALELSRRIHTETVITASGASIPQAAVELSQEFLGGLVGRKVVVMGAGKLSELTVECLRTGGAGEITIVARDQEHGQQLANRAGGKAVAFEDRAGAFLPADLVICATASPHILISREEIARLAGNRGSRSFFFVDMAVPRNIDPEARQVPGVFVYDIDDLAKVAERRRGERQAVCAEAEFLVATAVSSLCRDLESECVQPTISALRERLDEMGREEVEDYVREFGPPTEAQRSALQMLGARIVHRIAGSLAREIQQLPEPPEQEKLTTALRRLFHLERPPASIPRH
jgi:glutamyl-tRNA reductase